MSTSETPNKLTVKERLLAAIEDAPEFALKEALRAIEIFKDIDFNDPEAFEDALDVFGAISAKDYSRLRGEESIPWSQVKVELGLS